MAFKRLPNGFGSIDKLPGSRRKPYRARKRVGDSYFTIGYFETREEALRQLALTNADALVKEPDITYEQCYGLWVQEYQQEKPLPKGYITASEYLKPIYKREIASLRAIDLETIINSSSVPRTVKRDCVVVLHGVFGYALRHEIIDKDYSRIAKYITDNKPQIERKIFTAEDIDLLWKKYGNYEKFTLFLLYTGMRVSEAIDILKENVHLEEMYMVGGNKTESGRNRIIPIHSTIYGIVEEKMKDDGSPYLFHTKTGNRISRQNYSHHLRDIYHHSPHETRHSFITAAYKCGIKEADIKRIVGHSQGNVTQETYVHADWQYLTNEIDKLYY